MCTCPSEAHGASVALPLASSFFWKVAGTQSWASFFLSRLWLLKPVVFKRLAFGEFRFTLFLKGGIAMIRSSHGTPAIPNPMAQRKHQNVGVSRVLLNESVEGGGRFAQGLQGGSLGFYRVTGSEELHKTPQIPWPGWHGWCWLPK